MIHEQYSSTHTQPFWGRVSRSLNDAVLLLSVYTAAAHHAPGARHMSSTYIYTSLECYCCHMPSPDRLQLILLLLMLLLSVYGIEYMFFTKFVGVSPQLQPPASTRSALETMLLHVISQTEQHHHCLCD